MTCRMSRNPSKALVAHLHAAVGSVRVVEIDGFGPISSGQLKCPNCSAAVRLISAANRAEYFSQQIYQCDDCLGKVRFILKRHP
jgi:hypothetical protein